jgi:CRP-like cAMP-binding protein
MSAFSTKNLLLQRLPEPDLTTLSQQLTHVELRLKQVLVEVNQPIEHVYFPENGVCSALALTTGTNPIEVGMIGFEGMTDMVLEDGDVSFMRVIVQMDGTAWRMSASDFVRAIATIPSVNAMTLRYKHALAVQFAYTAFAHGSFTIVERLARWLLMSQDRSRLDSLPLVHEFLASMLAVRRSGVTTALHVLEGSGAIKATRGSIVIRDREKLREIASDSYGVPEAAYDRLMMQ